MTHYPAFLDLRDTPCVVIGGGRVAWRKSAALLACGACVTVVSPEVVRPLAALARRRQIVWRRRQARPGDVDDAFVIVAATDDPAVNRAVSARATARRRLINVVDQPALCSFIVPSVVSRGGLTIAISTGGASPALSKWLRRDLTVRYGRWVPRVLARMRTRRATIHRRYASPRRRKQIFETLLRQELRRAGIK